MHRFYLPPDQCQGAEILLAGREAHHGLHVLRLRPAERVVVLDGAGGEIDGEVLDPGRDQVRLRVVQRKTIPAPAFRITLVQAVPKGKLIESIIQKATELGVSRLVPLLSEHSSLRLEPDGIRAKSDKWKQVAIEAVKQCGSAWLPRIEPPMRPGEFLVRAETFDLSLVASLEPGARHPRESFRKYQAAHGRKPLTLCIWVGPEGDFSPDEIAAIRSSGAQPITLGPLVLRSETAATCCLSVLNYELRAPEED